MPNALKALEQGSQGLNARERFFMATLIADSGVILQKPERIALSSWLGHIPFAFWLTKVVHPRTMIELGCYHGASFCAFCQQNRQNPLPGHCYAVDTWKGDEQCGFYGEEVFQDIAAFVNRHYPGQAQFIRAAFDEAAPLFDAQSVDILHIDGLHTREAMLHDFETWLPKMAPGGVILMHDINARLPGYAGFEAWQEIRGNFPHFQFEHSYGLGVLLPGSNPPQPLLELTKLGPEGARLVQGHFARIGENVSRLWRHEKQHAEQEKANARLGDHISSLAEEKNRLLEELDTLKVASRQKEEEISRLQDALATQLENSEQQAAKAARTLEASQQDMKALNMQLGAMQRRIDEYERSNSWRLTAPLRKLRHILRGRP